MQIYTLNINGLRGSDKGIYDDVTKEVRTSNLKALKLLVDDILLRKENVIILQEVPHMRLDKNKEPWQWASCWIYQEFLTTFSNEYKILKPKHLINSNQCTVALCQKESFWDIINREILVYDSKYSFGNRLVELKYKDQITLLGLHMKPDDEMWELIFNSYRNNKHTFIVGDFNANERRGTMKNKPKQLRALGFNSFISNSIITDYKDKSSIDNIYVDTDLLFYSSISVNVLKTDTLATPFYTDHALCSLKFDIV